MLIIPEDKFEQDLTSFLMMACRDCLPEDADLLNLLYRLSKSQMYDRGRGKEYPFIADVKLTKEEASLITENNLTECNNVEIRAYCCDVLRQTARDKRELTIKSSEAYLELYYQTLSPWFLLRAVSVRSMKAVKSLDFLSELVSACERCDAVWLPKITEELKKTYSKDELVGFVALVKSKMDAVPDKAHRDNERCCMDALYNLGWMEKSVWHRNKALSFEAEVDYLNETKTENVFYANMPNIAQNAFNEIVFVKKEFAEDYDRLKKKLECEQKAFGKRLEIFGVKSQMSVPDKLIKQVDAILEKMELDNPMKLLAELAELPFIPKKYYDEYCKQYARHNPMLAMSFARSVGGDKGQTLGKADPEEAMRIQAHKQIRLDLNYFVVATLRKYYSENVEFDEGEVGNALMLYKGRASYIDDNAVFLWVKGILAGVKDDFITAVHILTPQIERALVKKAEQYCGSLTNLENRNHQDEAGLKKALDYLKPYMAELLYEEFYFFLIHGADINLRNNIAHGLWPVEMISRNGPYLWWLAVKLFLREDEIFKRIP